MGSNTSQGFCETAADLFVDLYASPLLFLISVLLCVCLFCLFDCVCQFVSFAFILPVCHFCPSSFCLFVRLFVCELLAFIALVLFCCAFFLDFVCMLFLILFVCLFVRSFVRLFFRLLACLRPTRPACQSLRRQLLFVGRGFLCLVGWLARFCVCLVGCCLWFLFWALFVFVVGLLLAWLYTFGGWLC